MRMWFFLCLVLTWNVSGAQGSKTYTIKPGDKVIDVIPITEIFQYPHFVTGKVVFKDGLATEGRLNYNSLIAEVEFIDSNGDTLALANEKTIRHILISKDTFYYDEGYLRLISGSAVIKLAAKVFFKEFIQKPGSYGLSTATTATNTLSSVLERRSYGLNTNQEMVLVKSTLYFIGDRFNKFLFADRKSILKIFPKRKIDIEDYLAKNPVDFNSEKDLIKLTTYIAEL